MAKYDINFACGHTAVIHLYGKESYRQERIKWMEEHSICPDCYKKQLAEDRAKAAEEAAAIAKEMGLPDLEGSPKQVSWANEIRNGMIKNANSNIEHISSAMEKYADRMTPENVQQAEEGISFWQVSIECIASEKSAKKFIDAREDHFSAKDYILAKEDITSGKKVIDDFSDKYFFHKSLKKIFIVMEPETQILQPEEKKSNVMAVITYNAEHVNVSSPKDAGIIQICKKSGYRWDGAQWQYTLSGITSGNPEDRAAEIANKLLHAGYQVTVPLEIADSAVSGNFTPLHTRWFTEYTSKPGKIFAKWGRDEDFYYKAKEISGAKYIRGYGVCVPASSADEIEDFAQLYDFRISGAVQKLIDNYRNKITIVAPEEAPKEEIDNTDKLQEILHSSTDVLDDLRDDD